MKRILPVFILILIIPQIAMAAWWNPFSWGIFHKTDFKTQVLENRIKELENKLESNKATTTSIIIPTTTSDKNQTDKSIDKTKTTNTNIITNSVQKPAITNVDIGSSHKDILNKYNEFKSQVESDIATLKPMDSSILIKRREYMNNFILNLDYEIRGLNILYPENLQSINLYVDKLAQLKSGYKNTMTNYLDEYNQNQEDSARKVIVDYIKVNKYSLYLTAKHITAATMFDLYDRAFNTKYAERFRLTKTQTETVEFANSFLLDLGESVTD